MSPHKDSFITLHIGIDSIDSPYGGCTTHFIFILLNKIIAKLNVKFIDYPNLIRLNPSVPFKTRGNGAVALHLIIKDTDLSRLIDLVVNEVINYTIKYSGDYKKVGIATLLGDEIPNYLREFFHKALTDYIHIDYLRNIIAKLGDSIITPLGLTRGTIGALASIAGISEVTEDCTYELLIYRKSPYQKPRNVNRDLLWRIDRFFSNYLFSTFDRETDKLLAVPHGPDPVLMGIRGEDPEVLQLVAHLIINNHEDVSGYIIFRTNQGTDQHLTLRDPSELKVFRTGCIRGEVINKPKILRGGDVLLNIYTGTKVVTTVFFRETGLSNIVRKLIEGDEVEVCGTMKYWIGKGPILHSEKLVVLKLIKERKRNPKCPKCGHRMKSAGRNKGFKCPKCGFKLRNGKVTEPVNREIHEGIYVPPNKALKHLNKPRKRYGKKEVCRIVEPQSFFWSPHISH